MSSPPPTPPTKSKWGRMGGVMRRASTVLAISQVSRPGTPASERDSDSVSLKRTTSREVIPSAVAALSPPSQPTEASLPTPIAESPAREAEALKQEIVGPSPLAQPLGQETRPASPEPMAMEPAAAPSGGEDEQATSPTGYVPPPVIDSSAGNPGAFTDDPEALPQPDVVVDPYAPPPAETATDAPPAVVDSSAGKPGAFADDLDDLPQPAVIADPFASTPNPVSYPTPVPAEKGPEPKSVEAPTREPSMSYFDKPMAESMKDFESVDQEVHGDTPKDAVEAVGDIAATGTPAVAAVAEAAPEAASESAAAASSEPEPAPVPTPAPAPAPQEAVDLEHAEAASRGDPSILIVEPVQAPPPTQPTAVPAPVPTQEPAAQPTFGAAVMPQYEELPSYSGHDIWGGAIHNSTSQQKPQEEGGHDVWATGTIAAAAAAAGAVATAAVVGGMASSRSGQQEEEHTAYTSTMPIPIPGSGSGNAPTMGRSLSQASSVRVPLPNPHPASNTNNEVYTDLFADPLVPRIAVSHSDSAPQQPTATQEESHGGIIMPLPAFHEVIPSTSMHRVPSHSSSFGGGNGQVNLETDERIPLLARPATPNKGHKNVHNNLYAPHAPTPQNHAFISPLLASSSGSSWNPNTHSHYGHENSNSVNLRLHELGWLEYHLPDGTVYYVHPTRRVTTDANLRKESVLAALEAWLEMRNVDSDTVNVGVEAWVREVGAGGKGGRRPAGKGGKKPEPAPFFERYWVDHIARTVVKEDLESERRVGGYGRGNGYSYGHSNGHTHAPGKGKKQAPGPSGSGAGGSSGKNEEDQLDLEYRFWSFMESYPAHSALPAKARAEAMDVLTWAWTDRLLPSHRAIPSPFTQEECQELMTLLRSFNEHHHDDHGIQTRVVARILLRVAQWRQTYFRPNKPLPRDVSTGGNKHLPVQRQPLRRAFFDFFVSCLCLGIPYLFLERARLAGRVADHESGLLRSTTPMVIIGACTCLVAAIVLSASVTFLSLPGLDSVARTAGMVAVLFAAFTMAATGLAVLRHKADLERPVPHVGVEGLMVVSRRTIALSLPLVFLAYSVIGFVTGIILYSYRGVSTTDPSLTKSAFEDYTRWTVVGVVGALAGIVTTSMLVLRR